MELPNNSRSVTPSGGVTSSSSCDTTRMWHVTYLLCARPSLSRLAVTSHSSARVLSLFPTHPFSLWSYDNNLYTILTCLYYLIRLYSHLQFFPYSLSQYQMSTCVEKAILADPTHPADRFCHRLFTQEIAVSLLRSNLSSPTPIASRPTLCYQHVRSANTKRGGPRFF